MCSFLKPPFITLLLFAILSNIDCNAQNIQDATKMVQKMIDNAAPNSVIDGRNKTYHVSSLYLKSNITIQNFNFIALPSNKDFNSVLNIIGGKSVATDLEHIVPNPRNITINNVSIDGNRIAQNNISSPIEDGGRHGIRIIGKAADISIIGCSIKNCASDGICIFTSNARKGSQINLPFRDILIKNTSSEYNRRHGLSGDGIDGMEIENCNFSFNGLCVSGVQLTAQNKLSGKVGASVNAKGELLNYGSGIDFEGYGPGSRITNITITNSKFLRNARHGLLFLDNTYGKGFLQRNKITIVGCQFDYGVVKKGNEKAALSFVGRSGNVYTNVTLKNNTFNGYVVIRYSSGFNFINNQFNPPKNGKNAIILVQAKNIRFNNRAIKSKIYAHLSNFTFETK